MAHVRIELLRNGAWSIRAEGDADVTAEDVRTQLPAYALQYPHRAFFDGEPIGECQPESGGA